MTRSASYARAAALVLGVTALLGLFAVGCGGAKHQDSVACGQRCASAGGYVKDLETFGIYSVATGCICVFQMPFADAGVR